MRLGLISDIHADLEALTRALDLLAERGADKVVCLGDLVEKGTDGDRVVALLQQQLVVCVRGNHDDNAVRRFHEEGDGSLDAESIDFLASLPAERRYAWEGLRVILAHAAPAGIDDYVFPDAIPKRLKRSLRSIE